MQTNEELTPTFRTLNNLDAPFGRRDSERAIVRNKKRASGSWFWGQAFLLTVLFTLFEITAETSVVHASSLIFSPDASPPLIGQLVVVPKLVEESRPLARKDETFSRKPVAPIDVIHFDHGQIPLGSQVSAVLITGGTNGLIKAQLTEPLMSNGSVALEAGTILIGHGHSSEERLFIDFKKAIPRDSQAINVSAQAYDSNDAILGLKGSRVGDAALKLAASSGLNFISGLALGLREPGFDEFGRARRPTIGEGALGGVTQASADQAKNYLDNVKNKAPVIEVKKDTAFILTFDGED